MLPLLVSFSVFLRSYVFSAFRLVNRYVFRFQIDGIRSEPPENGRVDSEPSELPENDEGSEANDLRFESGEMVDENNGETRNSAFCSVSTERFDSHGVFSGKKLVALKSSDEILDFRLNAGDDISEKVQTINLENSVSNVFDKLPEPEVQVLWEDYSIPSDSESETENLTSGSPKINEVDPFSDVFKAEINIEEDKQRESAQKLAQEEKEIVNSSEKSTETNWKEKPSTLNFDYKYELNYLPDHQDIIQQLELELGNARTGGLPTIFEEESETTEEIDEKCKYEERMEEIQKAHMKYAEKMRKLDVLNNQIMHVIGLLQLKSPTRSISKSGRARRLMTDPIIEFIHIQTDMELVYVGQVCLSWEILQWQLRKALELRRDDSQSIRRYNRVASEFKLFQLVLRRFMEGERCQDHRVENYVENRCVFRSLLQVPAIKDDGFAEAEVREWEYEDRFSSIVLAEIMEESIWIFCEFLLADKEEGKIEPQSSESSHLSVVSMKAQLQKAERRLKDVPVRSSNRCSMEEMKEEDEAGLSYALMLLMAQVDLKLISRVLRMSRLTVDQLSWCNRKLHQITFVNRKVHREPSPLFFPF